MSGSASYNYNSPVDFLIEQAPPGKLDAGSAPAINELYQFSQQVIYTFMNYCGIGPQNSSQYSILQNSSSTLLSGNLRRFYVEAVETILFGAIVNLTAVEGQLFVRNANATNNSRPADGICSEPEGIAVGAIGEVQLSTGVLNISAVVPGQRYWLSTSNGIVQPGPATNTGNIEQYIGIGLDANHIYVNISPSWIQH